MSTESFFGDPTLAGWVLTIGYLTNAVLCGVTARRRTAWGHSGRDSSRFWGGLAVLLLLLGLNKQLDLQSAMIGFGRSMAQRQGWYEGRRLVQAVSMVLLAVGVAGGFVWVYLQARASFRAHPGALLGILILLSFILVRAFAFNHVLESLLNTPVSDRIEHALEGSALILIGVSAWRGIKCGARGT